jgi:hypothetical protein
VKNYLLKNKSIKYVVLSSSFLGYFGVNDTVMLANGNFASGADVSYINFMKTVTFIKNNGKKPILFAPPPHSRADIQDCFYKSIIEGDNFSKCNFSLEDAVYFEAPFYDILISMENFLSVVYMHKVICPQKNCVVHRDGIFIYRDGGHLAIDGSRLLGKEMDFYNLIKGELRYFGR